jgi:peptidoglycan/xylan/chitin deacetylase (PgdA/CDA1 family)
MKHVKVNLSIVGVISVLATILIGLYSTSHRVVASSEHEDDEHNKFAILTFDDGYKSQYTNVKPILDKYGYKGTFYVVCNYAEKEDKDRMNWNEIQELQKQGHDIESHSMSHANLTDIPAYRVDIEIGVSKQCLVSQGFNVTSFSYPFAQGSQNESIVDTVAKYYSLGRTADAPLMFLDCSGWDNSDDEIENDISLTLVSSSNDENDGCREYSTHDNSLNAVNRYSIMGWTHDSERRYKQYDDSQMLERFIEVVEGQSKYNDEGKISAIPIVIWHNIEDNTTTDIHTTTSTNLFEAEIRYLHDNGFTVLTMDDLVYDEYDNTLKIKEGKNNSDPSIIKQVDYSEGADDDGKSNNRNQ